MNEAAQELELQKLELERRRLEATLEHQAKELEARVNERKHDWIKGFTPAVTSLLVGLVGGIVALLQVNSQAKQQIQLETVKARNALILQAMQTGDVEKASANLLFLATNKIIDLEVTSLAASLEKYKPTLPSAEVPRSALKSGILPAIELPETLPNTEASMLSSIRVPKTETTISEKLYVSRGTARITGIVVHSTFSTISPLDTQYAGGYHWLVTPSGEIQPRINEKVAAYHIGNSRKAGWTNRTTLSVGITGMKPLSNPEQAAALYALMADMCKRNKLKVEAIITHDEVQPGKREGLEPHITTIRTMVYEYMNANGGKFVHWSAFLANHLKRETSSR